MKRFKTSKNEINESISRINDINKLLQSFEQSLKYIQDKSLSPKIDLFKSEYVNYINLKRFSIPVIGKINSGKSTFLNYLLDLNDLLESSENITTKFICLIRHNKELKGQKPKIFKVILDNRAEINKELLWNFNKGEEIEGDVKEIIKYKNVFLSEQSNKDYDDYFAILETYIPFFQYFNCEEISEYFEFIDVPGLSEISNNSKIENIYNKSIIPILKYNIKFTIFIFDAEFYKDENNSKNLFNYYDKTIKITLNNDTISTNEININPIPNSLYILNKNDLCGDTNKKKKSLDNFRIYLKEELKIIVPDKYIMDFCSIKSLKKK